MSSSTMSQVNGDPKICRPVPNVICSENAFGRNTYIKTDFSFRCSLKTEVMMFGRSICGATYLDPEGRNITRNGPGCTTR
jgi:hypothetical protein